MRSAFCSRRPNHCVRPSLSQVTPHHGSRHKNHPTATTIVITGAPSMDGAITAIQGGAVDFLPKPFDHKMLVERVRGSGRRRSPQTGRLAPAA